MASSLAKVQCTDCTGLISAMNRIVLSLPKKQRVELNRVFSNYLRTYGLDGAYVKLKDRTVDSLLEEFAYLPEMQPIAKGNVESVTFALYESKEHTQGDRQGQSNCLDEHESQ